MDFMFANLFILVSGMILMSFILTFFCKDNKIETRWEVLDISEEEFKKIPQKERAYLTIKVTRKKYDEMTENEFQEFI